MHHSFKIKIQDLDYIESIVEQDITDVRAEKIVGGSKTSNANPIFKLCKRQLSNPKDIQTSSDQRPMEIDHFDDLCWIRGGEN
ncbi:hypothetical protein [Nostoc favosum]|uniref:Uncharacterized protein n=1 Tax=Nostoc favosum CHAB5714 TaxID=2780399 RepID=A0ABS8I7F0_9NOSO|nr:hypothetical protein [Nostoc favosum]MCC5599734.1 hypothetical protein [Nostoc favosum CHAB5714]